MAANITKGVCTEKWSVITFSFEVNARDVRNYLMESWQSLTKNLDNSTILFISGMHGSDGGKLGGKSDGCKEMKNQVLYHRK